MPAICNAAEANTSTLQQQQQQTLHQTGQPAGSRPSKPPAALEPEASCLELVLVLVDGVGLGLDALALPDVQDDGVGQGARLRGSRGATRQHTWLIDASD